MFSPIFEKLKGGDRRSIGKSKKIVKDILDNPKDFVIIFNAIKKDDPVIKMRAFDVIKKCLSFIRNYLKRLLSFFALD